MPHTLQLRFRVQGARNNHLGLLVVCDTLDALTLVHNRKNAQWPARIQQCARSSWSITDLTLEAARCNQVLNPETLHTWQTLPLWSIWSSGTRHWITLRTFLRKNKSHALAQGLNMPSQYWMHVHQLTRQLQMHQPAATSPSSVDCSQDALLRYAAEQSKDSLVQLAAREFLASQGDMLAVEHKVEAQVLRVMNVNRRDVKATPSLHRRVQSEVQRVLDWVRATSNQDPVEDAEPLNPAFATVDAWSTMMQPWLQRVSRADNDAFEPVAVMPPQDRRWNALGDMELLVAFELKDKRCKPMWINARLLAACEPNRSSVRQWMQDNNITSFVCSQ